MSSDSAAQPPATPADPIYLSEGSEGNDLSVADHLTLSLSRIISEIDQGQKLSDEYVEELLRMVCEEAVKKFCDWCIIDLVDAQGRLHSFATTHLECGNPHCRTGDNQPCSLSPAQLVSPLAQLGESALVDGSTKVWPDAGSKLEASCIVIGLCVNDIPFGTVSFVVSHARKFDAQDVASATEAVRMLDDAIERSIRERQPRATDHQAIRLVGQLHLLHQAASALATISDEREIMICLASHLRRMFDANVSQVVWQSDQLAPLWSMERREEEPVCFDAREAPAPEMNATADSSVTNERRMTAPLLDRAKSVRGFIAVQRSPDEAFSPEEDQVLRLFCQIATTALEAAQLRNVIHNGENRLRLLIDTAPIGIIEVDFAGAILWWNRSATEIFNWPHFEDGSGVAPLFPVPLQEGLRELWDDASSGGVETSHDFLNTAIGREVKDLSALATLLPTADGQEQRIWTLINDVTNHRQLKEELRNAQRMELRGQVASSVAHDFNNLLSLISGYAEILLRDHANDERAVQMVSEIQSTAARASVLTVQLQTVGRTKWTEPIVLSPSVEIQLLAEVLERIVGVDINIVWALDPTEGNVRIDADQFEQMILNLTLNARDAMPSGGELRIGVDSVTIDDPKRIGNKIRKGEYLLISVSDTGHGMDSSTVERCFEPMFTTKGPLKGTGLGLSTARRLVEESGGTIQCVSQPGLGTTFNIFLPKSYEVVRTLTKELTEERIRGSARILVVEEDEGLRNLITQTLIRNGHQILEADNDERACELEKDFDGDIELLILGNYQSMAASPNLAQQLRATNPSLRLLLLGDKSDTRVSSNFESSSYASMKVPFKPSELIERVHDLLPSMTPTS